MMRMRRNRSSQQIEDLAGSWSNPGVSFQGTGSRDRPTPGTPLGSMMGLSGLSIRDSFLDDSLVGPAGRAGRGCRGLPYQRRR